MKRLFLNIASIITGLVLLVAPVFAVTPYHWDCVLKETGGVSYTNYPWIIANPTTDLITAGYLSASGLDSAVITGGVNVPHMLTNDKLLFVGDLPANSTANYFFYTGTSALTSFPIILGEGGYITVPDVPANQPANKFKLSTQTYVKAGKNFSIADKGSSVNFYTEGLNIHGDLFMQGDGFEINNALPDKYEYNSYSAADGNYRIESTNWYATPFTATANHQLRSIILYLKRSANATTGDLDIRIASDNSNKPGSTISQTYIAASALTESAAAYEFYFTPHFSITNGSTYWIVLSYPDGSMGTSSWINWNLSNTSGSGSRSANSGSTWTTDLTPNQFHQTVTDNEAWPVYGAYQAAQTFLSTADTSLYNVNLWTGQLSVRKHGSPTGNATITLKEMSSGEPKGSTVESTTMSLTGLDALTWTNKTFNLTTNQLELNTTYGIVVSYPAGDSSNYIEIRGGNTDSYNGGDGFSSTDTGANWSIEDDLFFIFNFMDYKYFQLSTITTQGLRSLILTADGTTATLAIDGVTKDTKTITGWAGVDTDSDWVILSNAIYSNYFTYYAGSIDGIGSAPQKPIYYVSLPGSFFDLPHYPQTVTFTEEIKFQPNTIIIDDTIPDLATGRDGTITWGSVPEGVSVALQPPIATATATPTGTAALGYYGSGGGIGAAHSPILTTPAAPTHAASGDLSNVTFPGAALINSLLDASNTPYAFFWFPLICVLVLVASYYAYKVAPSLLLKGAANWVLLVFFCATNVFGWYIFAMALICHWAMITHSRSYGL